MNRILRLGVHVLSVIVLCSEANAQGFTIAGVEAKLFYSNSGRLSSNIIGNPKIVLHNVVIGEGSVDGPSENTLLIVRVNGPAKSSLDGLLLHITATALEDTLADREVEVGTMNSVGNYYVASWLDDTGCAPVEVEVRLTVGKEIRLAKVRIPFECSE
jgi:hypothetical protein